MDQSKTESLALDLLQYAVECPICPYIFYCGLHEPANGFLNEDTFRPVQGLSTAPSWTTDIGAVDPFLIEESPHISPFSASSSTSYCESVPTLNHAGYPMRPITDLPASQPFHFSATDGSMSAEGERLCKLDQITLLPWDPHIWSPSPGCSDYDQRPLLSIQDFTAPSGNIVSSGCISPYAPAVFSAPATVQWEPYKQGLADLNEDYSGSESGGYESGTDKPLPEYLQSTKLRSRAKNSVMKLGKWALANSIPTRSRTKLYPCPFEHRQCAESPCAKKFERIEHLRRHVRTVHGDDRPYPCKVCFKAFSRRDNLREHYWTHVARDGRAGHNTKMSISQLKAILGHGERRLVKRLRMKLKMRLANKARVKS